MDEETKTLPEAIVEEAVAQIAKVMDGVTDELRCQVMAQLRRVYGG
jgi:hypothetical protein